MKRAIIFIVVLTFIFSLSVQLNAENQEGKKLFKRPDPIPGLKKVDPSAWETKRAHLMQAKERRKQMIGQSGFERLPADNPMAVDIDLDSSYTNWQDGYGDVYMTALCYNAGTSYAAMVEAEVKFYDIDNKYLGYDTGWVYGGTKNVQYGTAGYCTNEIAPGEWGFFWVWPNVSYASAYYYSVSFTYSDSTTWPWANAELDFYGSVYKKDTIGYLEFYGDVENNSYNYLTYYSEVHFAVFNNGNSKVLDVDWNFVDGATYGTSTSAIYPRTYEPFELWFLFAPYTDASGSYLKSFEWYEAVYSALPETNPPFGQFSTPSDHSNVASSIAVTGWALDDSGVDSVKIYRMQGNSDVYIGDATFVEGARPDVASQYPQYPGNTRAGWGYMMLTNFLPNGGNGTFIIKAIATDVVGKQTTLGTKTIYCDNAHAVKPFGAIDTPGQGGTATGGSYVNWGWCLTPQPNIVPTDGSTLNVFVDGVYLGHPHYNNYRSDIATLFPGYRNSNGAAGYFYLDTTGYSNGVHSIYWTAKDSGGNSDGIGSRYFAISNSRKAGSMMQEAKIANTRPSIHHVAQLKALPDSFAESIRVKKGFSADHESMSLMPDAGGISRVEINELGRIELYLSNPCSGHMIVGNRLMRLPVGSTLDLKKGIFSWIPGPGFLGKYNLVFVEKGVDGSLSKRRVTVTIFPGKR